MDVRHGVINVTVHQVWQIFLIAKVFTLTVEQLFPAPGLRVTVGAAALEF